MPTANEKKALWFLAIVALSGSGVRLWRASLPPPAAADSAALGRQLGRVDSVRALRHRQERPQAKPRKGDSTPPPRELVDIDQATAEQIESLPGIGPSLAKRIIDNRDLSGTYGDLAALCEVNGVGPALLEKLRPLVTFTGARRPLNAGCGDASKKPRKTRGAHTRQPR